MFANVNLHFAFINKISVEIKNTMEQQNNMAPLSLLLYFDGQIIFHGVCLKVSFTLQRCYPV